MMSPEDRAPKAGRTPVPSETPEGGLKSALTPSTDEAPGVPGFRTWSGVYWFVLAVFVAIVAAFTVFSRVYA